MISKKIQKLVLGLVLVFSVNNSIIATTASTDALIGGVAVLSATTTMVISSTTDSVRKVFKGEETTIGEQGKLAIIATVIIYLGIVGIKAIDSAFTKFIQ